jgi:hypothetical protein
MKGLSVAYVTSIIHSWAWKKTAMTCGALKMPSSEDKCYF